MPEELPELPLEQWPDYLALPYWDQPAPPVLNLSQVPEPPSFAWAQGEQAQWPSFPSEELKSLPVAEKFLASLIRERANPKVLETLSDVVSEIVSVHAYRALPLLRKYGSKVGMNCGPLADTQLVINAASNYASRQSEAALSYLRRHPWLAARTLLPLAFGRNPKDRNFALAAVTALAARGDQAIVEEVAWEYGPEAVEAIPSVLAFHPWDALLLVRGMYQVAEALVPRNLPHLILADGSGRLGQAASWNLGAMLVLTLTPQAGRPEPYHRLAEVKRDCEPHSLEKFLWAFYERWMEEKNPDFIAVRALGWLGSDLTVPRLGSLVHKWETAEDSAKLVDLGVAALQTINTPKALAQLHRLSDVLKEGQGLREALQKAAQAHGLTLEDLEKL